MLNGVTYSYKINLQRAQYISHVHFQEEDAQDPDTDADMWSGSGAQQDNTETDTWVWEQLG